MLDNYELAGRKAGYWGRRFKQAVVRSGGLATAKRMLKPLKSQQAGQGFQALVEAGHPELSVEALALKRPFRALFTREELAMARARLRTLNAFAKARVSGFQHTYPDEAPPGGDYLEGALRWVLVNAFE